LTHLFHVFIVNHRLPIVQRRLKNNNNLTVRRFLKIWAHFLLRKKPGFAGLRAHALRPRCMSTYGGPASWLLRTPPEANPQDLRPLAQLWCPPQAATVDPKRGVLRSKTPEVIAALRQLLMIDTLAIVFERGSFG
jgi:hypothetical protein